MAPEDRPTPGRTVLALCGLALLIGVVHLPLRHGAYVQDDRLAVERNQIVDRGSLEEIFSTSYWEGARGADRTLFRPIVIGSYAAERRLTGGLSAPRSRGINVALHTLVTFALMLLARRLGLRDDVTLAAGALFAVHPLHVEAIANVVGRAELLAALFAVAALVAVTHTGVWNGRSPRHPRLAAWIAGALLFLALGSKEIAVATPFLMVALVALFAPPGSWRNRDWRIDRAAALAPSLLACVAYLALRVQALEMLGSLQRVHPLDNLLVNLSGVERWATALGLLTRYARLFFYPVNLANDYSGLVIGVESGLLRPRPLGGALLLLGLLAPIAAQTLRRALPGDGSRNGARCAFCALLGLLPYAVIGNLFFIVGAALAERFMYLPSVGFCLLFALGLAFLSRLLGRPTGARALAAIVALLVAAFAGLSYARCLDWRDDLTVFSAAARVNPKSPRAHHAVGQLTLRAGDAAGAIPHLERALALWPDHPAAWLDKGNALAAQGRYREAQACFREALRIRPSYGLAHRNLALALRHEGRLVEAEQALRKAALWRPDSANTWAETGNLYLQLERYEDAARAYRKAIARGRRDLGERLALAERGAARSGD